MASSDQAAVPSSGTASMPESLRRLSITNPIVFSSTTWAALCVGYALWQVPEAPLTSPELLREQLKLRIRSIPVPASSPRYQQFKEYYTREHDLQLQEYKAARAKWQQSTAAFNWRAFAQGLGVGVLILCGALAVLEYHYGAISYWMEVAEELWSDAQQKRQKRLQLADSAKMERLLQEMGEGAEDAGGKGGPSKRRKSEGESRQRVKSPAASETKAAAVTPSQPVPVSSVPTVPKEDAPKASSTPTGLEATAREVKPTPAATEQKSDNPTLLQGSSVPSTFGSTGASRLRERLRCKVIERHRQQAEQATTPSSQESSGNVPDLVEPAPKKEKKSKNKKSQAKKEEAPVAKKEPEAKPQAKPEETAPAPAAPSPPAETPATPTPAPANDVASPEVPPVERPSAAEKDAPVKVEQATSKKSKNGKAKKAETRPAENNSRTASKEAPVKPSARKADPEVEAALQRLARQPLAKPSLRGPALLREAQELLSRLEAEDLLKQLETEEEHARRAAGKKKAKKNKAAARAKAGAKKGQKGEAPVEVLKATLPGTEADAEDENVEIEEEVASEPSEIKLEEADKKESEEESTEMHSSDGHDTHSSSAASDEERCGKKAQAISIAEERGKKQEKMDRLQRAEAVREAKVEATTAESSAPADSFNGALAGAQILDFLRSGKPDKESRAEPSRNNKSKSRQQKEPEAPVQSKVQAKAKATPKPAEKVQPKMPSKADTKAKEEKETGSSEDSTELHSSDGQDSRSSFSASDEESGKRVEAAAPVWNDPSFNGALAGAQILDFLRSGPARKEPDSVWKGKSKSWPCPPESKEAEAEEASSLRAEAPEFVPGQTVNESSEDPQPVMVMGPDQLPPGCQFVMFPVQMPMFEAMVMPMPPPASAGCMMMPMNMDMMPMESPADWTPAGEAEGSACCPDVDKAEKEQERTEEPSACESDDDCDSIFGEPPALKRQMTI